MRKTRKSERCGRHDERRGDDVDTLQRHWHRSLLGFLLGQIPTSGIETLEGFTFVFKKALHDQAYNQSLKSLLGSGSFHLLTFSKYLIVTMVVPLNPWGTCPKIPRGCLKSQITRNPAYTIFSLIHTYL